jgi:acetyltransferase-like isoleucine patch superfamily enzyme
MLGPRVSFVGDDHRYDLPGTPMIFSGRPPLRETLVESDVWIGYGSVILSGVCIGRGSIVAAGSVVTKSIPPYEIWGGVPARRIKARFEAEASRQAHDRMLDQKPTEGQYAPPRR